eukprot:COSAG02_NODE_123_length_35269_cov_51.697526_5_plen_109_part_00
MTSCHYFECGASVADETAPLVATSRSCGQQPARGRQVRAGKLHRANTVLASGSIDARMIDFGAGRMNSRCPKSVPLTARLILPFVRQDGLTIGLTVSNRQLDIILTVS